MKKLTVLLVTMLCSTMIFAAKPTAKLNDKVLHPSIHMLNIKAVKVAENNGDELYLSVTEYPSKGKPRHYQLPKYPHYWPSAKLEQLKDINIWDAKLAKGQSVTLIISLIEQDTPPWNTDDLIGSIRIHLSNRDGELESSWSMPNRADAVPQITSKRGQAYKYSLLGEGTHYELYLLPKLDKKK